MELAAVLTNGASGSAHDSFCLQLTDEAAQELSMNQDFTVMANWDSPLSGEWAINRPNRLVGSNELL
jgi:hypothetical protein